MCGLRNENEDETKVIRASSAWDFRKLLVGRTISGLGTSITSFALPTLAVLVLHASAFEVGILVTLAALPYPIFGLFAGLLADLKSRRSIMVATDIFRALALFWIPIAAMAHLLQVGQLYLVAFLVGLCSVFFDIASQSYLPEIVERTRLGTANTKLEFAQSGSEIVGKSIAGILVQWIGAALSIGIDAFSYLASAVALLLIKPTAKKVAKIVDSPLEMLQYIAEGIRLLVRERYDLGLITLSSTMINLGAGFIMAVIFPYAYRTLHMLPQALGLVIGLSSVGFLGALLASPAKRFFGFRVTLIISSLLISSEGAILLAANAKHAAIFMFLSGFIPSMAVPIYGITTVTYRQTTVDDKIIGRVNATMRVVTWGAIPLGSYLGAVLAEIHGVRTTLIIGAIIQAAAACWLLRIPKTTKFVDEERRESAT